MAWTQADIDKLDVSIASGVKRVTFGDQTMEFHDLAEMRELRAQMQREVSSPRRTHFASVSKGT